MVIIQEIESCSLYTGETVTTSESAKEEPQQEKPSNGSGEVPSNEIAQVIDNCECCCLPRLFYHNYLPRFIFTRK